MNKPYDPDDRNPEANTPGAATDGNKVNFNSILVGMKFHPPSLEVLDILRRQFDTPWWKVILLREPKNRFDRNAIQVWLDVNADSVPASVRNYSLESIMLGFISKNHNSVLAARLDRSAELKEMHDARLSHSSTGNQWWVETVIYPEGLKSPFDIEEDKLPRPTITEDDEIPF